MKNANDSQTANDPPVRSSVLLDRVTEEIWNTPAGEPVPQPDSHELENFWDCALQLSRHNQALREYIIAWLKSPGAASYRQRLREMPQPAIDDLEAQRVTDGNWLPNI